MLFKTWITKDTVTQTGVPIMEAECNEITDVRQRELIPDHITYSNLLSATAAVLDVNVLPQTVTVM